MNRVAVVLQTGGKVAPVDDSGLNFNSIKMFEVNDSQAEEVEFIPDPRANDFVLSDALRIANATDVIGQHFEEKAFNELKRHGFRMWLEAPEIHVRTALKAWHEGVLPQARVGAHAVQTPTGTRTRKETPRERHGSHPTPGTDRGVHSPVEGGKTPF